MIPWTGVAELLAMQRPDGAWRGDCQGGPQLTAVTLMIEQRFGVLGGADRQDGVRWLRSQQRDDGGFAWAPKRAQSDLTATACVWAGLRAVGVPDQDPAVRQALSYMATRGGVAAHDPVLQALLSADGRLAVRRPPARASLGGEGWPGALWREVVPALFALASPGAGGGEAPGLSRRKRRKLEDHLSERQNPDGSWGGELLTTLACAVALHLLGVAPADPRIAKAMDHLAHWKRQTPDGLEVLARSAEVRNTADAVRLLCDSGLANPPDDKLVRAVDWMLDQQAECSAAPDWVIGTDRLGGWSAGPHNPLLPDCATTGAVLGALGALSEASPAPGRILRSVRRGAAWLLAMQHKTGGWSPYGVGPADPETTAQALAGLGRCGYRAGDPPVDQAVRMLRNARTSAATAEALYSVGLQAPVLERTATPPPPADVRDRTAERIRRLLEYA